MCVKGGPHSRIVGSSIDESLQSYQNYSHIPRGCGKTAGGRLARWGSGRTPTIALGQGRSCTVCRAGDTGVAGCLERRARRRPGGWACTGCEPGAVGSPATRVAGARACCVVTTLNTSREPVQTLARRRRPPRRRALHVGKVARRPGTRRQRSAWIRHREVEMCSPQL